MEVSIIIPVYNEEKILEKNVRKLSKFLKDEKIKNEIIICDNGSTDKTSEIGKFLEKRMKNVRYLRIDKKAPGLAFKEGILKAKSKKIISLDADLTINYKSFIKRALRLLEEYEMVIGSKISGRQKRSFFRKFISFVFILLCRILLGLKFTDYSIGAKAYKKEFLLKFIDNIDEWTFYPVKLAYFSKKCIEIPVACNDKRKSRFNIFYEIFYRFKNLIIFTLKVKYESLAGKSFI